MASGQVAHRTVSPANVIFESPVPRVVASYEGELTRTRLREALAREETLLRRIDTLIRRQQILDRLFTGGEDAAHRLERLTSRERQIMERVLAGEPSRISQRISVSANALSRNIALRS
jgi:hypothetical protein